MAAPSPSTSPLRSFENGLHDADGSSGSSVASVFRASHAFSVPNVSGASAPPASISGAAPLRTRSQASPIATADEEHAVENVKFGPDNACSMPNHDAAALFIAINTVYGLRRSELS